MLRVWPWLLPRSRRGCDGDVLFSPPFLENLEKLGNDSWKGSQAGGRACRDSESPPFAGVQEHEGVWVLSSTIRIWELGAWARPQEKGWCGKVSNNRIERSLCVCMGPGASAAWLGEQAWEGLLAAPRRGVLIIHFISVLGALP